MRIIFLSEHFWKHADKKHIQLLDGRTLFSQTKVNIFVSFFSVVNELILKEKSEHSKNSKKQDPHEEGIEEGALSSSSSVLAESSAKSSSSVRSSMQSSSAGSSASNNNKNNSNSNKPNLAIANNTRLDESSNDSGHNSMNTSKSTTISCRVSTIGELKVSITFLIESYILINTKYLDKVFLTTITANLENWKYQPPC